MMIYDVFGKKLAVEKVSGRWQVFRLDESQGKRSRLHDVVIPDFIDEAGVTGWLDDIYHESSSAKYPSVVRVR